jgi:hypothetical protein
VLRHSCSTVQGPSNRKHDSRLQANIHPLPSANALPGDSTNQHFQMSTLQEVQMLLPLCTLLTGRKTKEQPCQCLQISHIHNDTSIMQSDLLTAHTHTHAHSPG